ncbi:MAG: acyltransferase domain-containing protein, partial [Sedimentisphaerales bacterium]|nr:acyltransferase domain-containing protein [Sedimentisphaerales bacterium]
MKTAFLFPGQGAQAVGMGADIAGAFEEAACVYEKANEILGYDLKSICFDGPAEKLNTTTVSQPAIFATSAAVLEVFRALDYTKQIQPDITAGLSLGEYTALYAAGVMSFEEGLKLVAKRGQAMQTAADAQAGSMACIIGLEEDKIRQLCEAAAKNELLEPVNFNCPGQIVVSGTKTACSRAAELAAEYGAIKAVSLEVAGAFHTDMMSTAAEILEQALRQ